MKRTLIVLTLAMLLALFAVACGSSESEETTGQSEDTAETQQDVLQDQEEETQESLPVEEEMAVQVNYALETDAPETAAFREPPTDYDQGIVFSAVRDVTEFCFFEVNWADEEGGWGPLEGPALYTQEVLTANQPILIVTNFPGDMPNRGISYTEGGEHWAYTLSTSGLDGSLLLTPIEAMG